MLTDKLKLNDSKTKFLIIGTRKQLNKVCIEKISVGDSATTPVSAARNLGTLFDQNLSFKSHISNTYRAAFYHIHNIRRIRKYLSLDKQEL